MNEVSEARSPGFRPDIQGLRAVAVLLVFVDHLLPGRLTGGFVGVDVFFVVSGYLITSLLLREGTRHGRISLTGFYARRARRIIPAAAVVAIVTVVVSLLTLPLLRVQTILTDAVWATFFAANVRMASVGTDYFAQGQPPSPLRHYWSLAVEEQFYLLWPLVLVAVLVLVRRHAARHAGPDSPEPDPRQLEQQLRRAAVAVVLLIAAASLAWSLWATYDSPTTAYYSSFTRGYELAAGAACALLSRGRLLSAAARQALAVAGVVAIAAAAWGLSGATAFPGAWALLPVLGTVALLLAGAGESGTAVGRLLSTRPMTVVGDWSYSIYLWHWPVIVLVRSNLGNDRFTTIPVLLGVVVLVGVLSWASYRFVENPFRRGSWRRTGRALLIYPVSIATVLATVAVGTGVVRYQLGAFDDEPAISVDDYAGERLGEDPYVALVRASVLAAQRGRDVPSDLVPGLVDLRSQTASLGECDYRTGTRDLCPIGDPGADRSIVVLGDSHARALSPAIERIGAEYGYRVYVLVYSGCSANALVQIERDTGRAWDECEDFKAWASQTIAELQPELTVVSTAVGRFEDPATGASLGGQDDRQRYLRAIGGGWRDLIERLQTSSDQVSLVGGTPKLPRETGVCLSRGEPDLGDCAFEAGRYADAEARASLRAARAVGAQAVDARRWFCADGLCPAVVGRFITMRDSEHVTPDYARWLATPLAVALGIIDRVPAEAPQELAAADD